MTHRDTIAEMLGFDYYEVPSGKDAYWRMDGEPWSNSHPIPNTLDFISAAWPDGWKWRHDYEYPFETPYTSRWFWVVWTDVRSSITLDDTGDELADRMALYAKVLEWLRAHDRPAFDAAVAKARRVMEGTR